MRAPTITLRTLKKALEAKGYGENSNKEVTHHKGNYYLLHILRNNVPVPYVSSEDPKEVLRAINLLGENKTFKILTGNNMHVTQQKLTKVVNLFDKYPESKVEKWLRRK